jgi:sigma-B regulation protein RsbU (phosphoserine phosphatase)
MTQADTTTPSPPAAPAAPPESNWRERLADMIETMREMSLQTDPQAMVAAYRARVRTLLHSDRTVSLSRRNLEHPQVRITRDTDWKEEINPWKETAKLPVLSGGKLAELIYGTDASLFDGADLPADDPAHGLLSPYRTIVAIPHFDRGETLNMVLLMWRAPSAFSVERLPEAVQNSSLFGRATNNLVLKTQLEEAYRALDRELDVVAEIQRSLLPSTLPDIPGVSLAASYQTSKQAGGDYYDIFALPGGQWGILIADVSGHGTPAAVVMAITHAISHSFPGPPTPPGALLAYVNQALATRYTADSGNFVTAFYGVYDPATRTLVYSSAGHNPPRLRRAGSGVAGLDAARSLPLGILPGEQYTQHSITLGPCDAILFYTDGITEAWSAQREMFGEQRLDELLAECKPAGPGTTRARQMVEHVLDAVRAFTAGRPADDDRTLMAFCVE